MATRTPNDVESGMFPVFLLSLLSLALIPYTIYALFFKGADASARCAPGLAKRDRGVMTRVRAFFKPANLAIIGLWMLWGLLYLWILYATKESAPFDPYQILRIPIGATEKDVKKAYRKLSLEYHPDKVGRGGGGEAGGGGKKGPGGGGGGDEKAAGGRRLITSSVAAVSSRPHRAPARPPSPGRFVASVAERRPPSPAAHPDPGGPPPNAQGRRRTRGASPHPVSPFHPQTHPALIPNPRRHARLRVAPLLTCRLPFLFPPPPPPSLPPSIPPSPQNPDPSAATYFAEKITKVGRGGGEGASTWAPEGLRGEPSWPKGLEEGRGPWALNGPSQKAPARRGGHLLCGEYHQGGRAFPPSVWGPKSLSCLGA